MHPYRPRRAYYYFCGAVSPTHGLVELQFRDWLSAQVHMRASTDHALLRHRGLPSGQTSAGCFYARANSGVPGAEMAISCAARATVVKLARSASTHGTVSATISFFGRQVGKMHRQMPSNLQFANSGCAGNIIAMRHFFPQN